MAIALTVIAGKAFGTYHFVQNGVTTWHGFAEAIFKAAEPVTGRQVRVEAITTADYPTPARRPANSMLDCTRFDQTFGVVRPHWSQSVAPTVTALTSRLIDMTGTVRPKPG